MERRNDVQKFGTLARAFQFQQRGLQSVDAQTVLVGWNRNNVQMMVAQNAYGEVVRRRFHQNRIAGLRKMNTDLVERVGIAARQHNLFVRQRAPFVSLHAPPEIIEQRARARVRAIAEHVRAKLFLREFERALHVRDGQELRVGLAPCEVNDAGF
ncbi:MAG: hypothetical protein HDKAJFGB_02806 [Anaerolineae bacterium]|nr:hypothetical protein [Anaerolineae bacterium]